MDMTSEILKPVMVLVLWSLVMLGWLMIARFPAMRAAGIDVRKLTGGKGGDADGVLPARAQWKAHNYNHLMEQPTLFYATALVLAVSGHGNGPGVGLAWAYVLLRITHSLVQATFNRVFVRFMIFGLASAVLIALAIHALAVLILS
jgi:hypothetical protein